MAKKFQKLSTAVRATFKDGTTKDYFSIEEASKETGVSINAIKIRCNKSELRGKDKIVFKWLDDSTARHYRAIKNRSKGNNYELAIIKDLTELGFKGLKTSRSESKNLDDSKIDIAETEDRLSCYIQCKATKNIPSISTITQECTKKDKPLVVFWKKQDSKEDVKEFVMMPKDYFYKLLTVYEKRL